MIIKGMNNESYDVASEGKANAGLTLGIIGTGLAALGGGLGNGLGGLFGGSNNQNYVNQKEFDLQKQISAKDMQIAILTAQGDVDKKLVDVYTSINDKVNAVRAEMNSRWEVQAGINTQQAVYNATNNSQIGCLANQVAQLQAMTKLVIPNSSVCPGWGTATVSVSTGTTTA